VRRPATSRAVSLAAAALATALFLAPFVIESADGEQTQRGDVISWLKGEPRPHDLPRDRLAPIAIHLEGGLRTANGASLPRVTRLEIGLPPLGVLSTRGLPICPARRIRNLRSREALAACRGALVGRGRLSSTVALPNQAPFPVAARLLAFNSRIGKRRAVLLHAATANPPTSSVLPMLLHRGSGRLGTELVGRVSASLGPWPRLRRYSITLFRRYRYRRELRSYLSGSCPVPPTLTAAPFSFARASYTFAEGGQISISIPRFCRAR
jgi:hypothetical protein